MKTQKYRQGGFTLVELAISLMVIGLLIGAVMKGREILVNARVSQAAIQWKKYDAAVKTFYSSYGALPGDISDPSLPHDHPSATLENLLPNCTAANYCSTPGNRSGSFETARERSNFWLHLLVTGLQSDTTTTIDANEWLNMPKTAFKAVFRPGSVAFNSPPFAIAGSKNVWQVLWNNSPVWHNRYIALLDRKIDDGNGVSGVLTVLDPFSCAPGGVYVENDTSTCIFNLEITQ